MSSRPLEKLGGVLQENLLVVSVLWTDLLGATEATVVVM